MARVGPSEFSYMRYVAHYAVKYFACPSCAVQAHQACLYAETGKLVCHARWVLARDEIKDPAKRRPYQRDSIAELKNCGASIGDSAEALGVGSATVERDRRANAPSNDGPGILSSRVDKSDAPSNDGPDDIVDAEIVDDGPLGMRSRRALATADERAPAVRVPLADVNASEAWRYRKLRQFLAGYGVILAKVRGKDRYQIVEDHRLITASISLAGAESWAVNYWGLSDKRVNGT